MNFINRAIKNIRRKITKSLLLLLTFFLIGNFVIVGLAISNASQKAKIDTRKQITTIVSLQLDYQKYFEDVDSMPAEEQEEAFNNIPKLTMETVNDIISDPRVIGASAMDYIQAYPSDGFDYIKLDDSDTDDSSQFCWTDEDGNEQCEVNVQPTFTLEGNYFSNPIELKNGSYQVTEGRFYNQDDLDNYNKVVLITEELAKLNNLKVGDSFDLTLFDTSYMPRVNELGNEINYENQASFEVIGIYQPKEVVDDTTNYWSASNLPDNKILLPATTIANINYQQSKYMISIYNSGNSEMELSVDDFINLNSVIFSLDDPESASSFISDQKTSLGEYYQLEANLDSYNKLVKPLNTIGLFSNFIVIFIIVNAIIIISLITAITLKNREYEIGVLLSLGTKKIKIIGQFFIELAIIAFIAFSLSVVTGSLTANKIGNTIWSFQANYDGIVELSQDNEDDLIVDPGFGWGNNIDQYDSDISYEDVASNYNVTVSLPIIIEIYLAALLIILIGIIIPSSMIMRFSPKKILSGIK